MRDQRSLIVLVLVTAAALAAGLLLVAHDSSGASGPESSAAAVGGKASAGAHTGKAKRKKALAAVQKTAAGLAYSADARSVRVRISATAYIAIDARTGRVLIAHHDRARRPIASLTKMMTSLLVIERGHLGREVKVPLIATQVEPNKEGLVAGHEYTRKLLLYSTLMVSSNDSATALGYDAGGGSLKRFYRMMNAKAQSLGMTDTTYKSASGLNDVTNLSSARDQAIVARAALREPLFAKIVDTWKRSVAWAAPTYRKIWTNHNLLLTSYKGTYGVKTGFTHRAGNCLVAAVHRGGHSVIAVVLDSTSIFYDMPRLLDKAFARLSA